MSTYRHSTKAQVVILTRSIRRMYGLHVTTVFIIQYYWCVSCKWRSSWQTTMSVIVFILSSLILRDRRTVNFVLKSLILKPCITVSHAVTCFLINMSSRFICWWNFCLHWDICRGAGHFRHNSFRNITEHNFCNKNICSYIASLLSNWPTFDLKSPSA